MARGAKVNKPKKKHRVLKIFLELQVVLIILVIAAITYYYVGGYANDVAKLRSEAIRMVNSADESTFRSAETSLAYDVDGNIISVLKGEKDVYYLEYSEIPIYAKEAIISIEDKKFYDHRGVDYRAIVRAAYAMLRNGKVTQGASTITQQLARGIFLTQDRTWERKIEELYISIELEHRYSKNQILEYYLNNIYFANGYYGIEAASRGYFNCSATDLSLSQIAFICAIPNSPNRYDPVTGFSNTITRRNLILRNMYDDGIISLNEYQDSLREDIYLNRQKKEKHDYQETYTFYCATKALMSIEGFEFKYEFQNEEELFEYQKEYNELYELCNKSLYDKGYRIYTSLDSDMQEELQKAVDDELKTNEEVNDEGIYALQGAAVCLDNETGLVKAIVGGRSQDYEGYTLNRAYQSFRQPGSAIKPLIVYTPILERGYTPDTAVIDEKLENGPENSGGGYIGSTTIRRAVELSRNTIAWKLFEELTPEVGLSYLKAMKFSNITRSDNVPAAALGGFTKGVSALEMAEGFCTIENDGYFREANCILKITDSEGNTIYQPEMVKERIYNKNAARQMTDILMGVLTSRGATGANLALEKMPAAGKTGTTNDNKDGWFVGYTPYYTTAVWVGFDTPKELPGLWGSTMPGKIWKNFMNEIHKDLENKAFNTDIEGVVAPDSEEPNDNEVEEESEIPEEDMIETRNTTIIDMNPE